MYRLRPKAEGFDSNLTSHEFIWALVGSTLVFLLASIVMSGFPAGLVPDINSPYTFNGDGLLTLWLIQRISEGWIWENTRAGYPFGSEFFDFPGSDLGSFLILKSLSYLLPSPVAVLNIFFLISFPAAFVATYYVCKRMGVRTYLAFSAGVVYSLASFHFKRLDHLFYAAYFVVPLYFYAAYLSYCVESFNEIFSARLFKIVSAIAVIFTISSFGVYYAVFGSGLFLLVAIIKWIKKSNFRAIYIPIAAFSLVLSSVFINLVPSIINQLENGKNPEVAQRSAVESEIYGFKPIQLLLPTLDHRVNKFSSLATLYAATTPNVNENHTASLGILGVFGLLIAVFSLLFKLYGRSVEERVVLFSCLVLVLVAVGASGGLGYIFASVVSPSIRAWNRVSIFILFGCLFLLFYILSRVVGSGKIFRNQLSIFCLSVLITLFGVLDQTPKRCIACSEDLKDRYELEAVFFDKIGGLIPPRAAIFQLPYIPFPESPYVNGRSPYHLLVPFFLSKEFFWSVGGMRGRDGDLFYRGLSEQPVAKQLSIVRSLGFSAVLVDAGFFPDDGKEILEEIARYEGISLVIADESLKLYLYQFTDTVSSDISNKSMFDVMHSVGFISDR